MKKSKHDKAINNILLKPNIIGLDNIIVSAKEVNLNNSKRLIGQPDLVFIDSNLNVYLVEYKCNDNHDKAKYQLQRDAKFIRNNLGIEVKKIYVNGHFEVEEIYR